MADDGQITRSMFKKSAGPRSLASRVRASAGPRNKRARQRKRKGYLLAGPVDVPPQFIPVLIELGYLDSAHVTENAQGQPCVEAGVLAGAWTCFLDRLAEDAEGLPDFLSQIEKPSPPTLHSSHFCVGTLGLPLAAPRMRFDKVERAAAQAGWKLIFVEDN